MNWNDDELIIKDKRLLKWPYCQKDTIKPKCGATSGRWKCEGVFPYDWMQTAVDSKPCLFVQLLELKEKYVNR